MHLNNLNAPVLNVLTAIGLTPGGSSTIHIYTETVHRTTPLTTRITINNLIVGRDPSLWVIPWHLPYNWGKAWKNLSQGS